MTSPDIILVLITLTTPSNVRVDINAMDIVLIREPRETDKLISKKVQCVIFTLDGKFVAVIETCEQVRDKLK